MDHETLHRIGKIAGELEAIETKLLLIEDKISEDKEHLDGIRRLLLEGAEEIKEFVRRNRT